MNAPDNLSRAEWVAQLFADGVPPLWCPPITHYNEEGAIDRARMAAHWHSMFPWVKAMLVPGSTGDGWELTEQESGQLMELALDQVKRLGGHLLIGALRPAVQDMLRSIQNNLSILQSRAGTTGTIACLEQNRVCGFAICPPRGKDLTERELDAALAQVLSLNVPCAVYQLPQVTQNEMSGSLLAKLAARFQNFILFKDTSGTDRVALSKVDLRGVYLVRGAEGNYARSLKAGGGAYDGFLLSTANCFGRQLHEIREAIRTGREQEADSLSERLSSVTQQMFHLVASVPDGNPFANAGKAVDHFFAFGPRATTVRPPRLHSGRSLPVEIIRETETILSRHQLTPKRGYLE